MEILSNLSTKEYIEIAIMIGLITILFFYRSKMNTSKKQILYFFILAIPFMIYFDIAYKNDVNKLLNNYSIAQAKIKEYLVERAPINGGPRVINTVRYFFKDNNNNDVYKTEANGTFPDEKPNLDVLYLVIYEKTNSKNCFLLINYPIKNNSDYEKYKEIFSKGIPKNLKFLSNI
jgi:hypothetical protein